MAIRLIVTFRAQAGKGGEFAEAFAPQMRASRGEAGCEQYDLFRAEDDPEHLVLLERWADQAALDAHIAVLRARAPSPTAAFRVDDSVVERYEGR